LADQLQDLTDRLKKMTKATAVYIGKLVQPKKSIEDNDNDKAHIDKDAERVINFLSAN